MKKDKKDKLELKVTKRATFGKALKKIRSQGLIPANIYGKNYTSEAIELSFLHFSKLYKTSGETQVIYLNLDGKEIPTLIHNVQKHPVTHAFLHVDFRKVDLKQKIEAQVPILFIGESEAVEQKKGDLLTILDELTISALPDKIPHSIEVDISSLKEVDDQIIVSNIKKSDDYDIIADQENIIAKIAEHKEEVIEPTPAAETIEGEAETTTEESLDEQNKDNQTAEPKEEPVDENKE